MADSTLSSATDASTQQHGYHRTPTLREVIEVMEELWPLSLAEPWDASEW